MTSVTLSRFRGNVLLAGLVPGAIVVPNVYIGMSHAQKKGVSYIFVD